MLRTGSREINPRDERIELGGGGASGNAVEAGVTLPQSNYGRRILGLSMDPPNRRRALDPRRTGKEASHLECRLKQLIAGQEDAIGQIVNMFQMHTTGLSSPTRPIGSFLFLGPTGTGKTRMVEAAAECLLHRPNPVIKIDCAEFQHSHEIAKLIGSPPGYLGHRETHPLLSQEMLNQYFSEHARLSFVLFDEIEKASDALWNLLLGILDKGILTLGDNRRVDFSRAMIFMTSNLGANEMSQIGNPKMGFSSKWNGSIAEEAGKVDQKMERTGVEAARRKFTPEFMNRLDKVVVFKTLGQQDLERILDIELAIFQQRLLAHEARKRFVFSAGTAAKTFILEQGADPRYGARHLKRSMERLLVQPMSNLLATEQIQNGDWIRVELSETGDELTFMKEAEGLPVSTMYEMVDQSVPTQLASLAAAVSHDTPRSSPGATAQKQRGKP